MDLGLLLAQFHAVYPGAFRDGEITAPLFWLLCRRFQNVLALARVQLTMGVMLGVGGAFNGRDVAALLEDDVRQAFPDG